MGEAVRQGRWTAEIDGDFVVFIIGAKPNSWRLIRSIRDQLHVTVLLVEHHMGLVMSLSDQVVVLNFGRVIANGTPDEVRNNPAVTEAYLGTRH